MQSTWRSVHSNWPSVHVHNIPTIPVTYYFLPAIKGDILFLVTVEDNTAKGPVVEAIPIAPGTELQLKLGQSKKDPVLRATCARAPRPRPAPTPARQGRGRFLLASGPRATPPGCGSRAPAPRAPPEEGAGRGGAGARGPGSACARRRQPGWALTLLIPPRRRPLSPASRAWRRGC